MDMNKAFDLTLHSVLFKKMLAAGFPAIFLRLFIHIYMNQVANVRWNSELSSTFTITNGVRQGAVLSAILYCFYCEGLFTLLEQRRSGCWLKGRYYGIFGYSDDNWLLAPSLNALQDMLFTCEEYAASHNLRFSTDPDPKKCKTKLMAFLYKPRELPKLKLCGNFLPWVDQLKHLGNTISNKIDGCQSDMQVKNAKYIDKCNAICQEFRFASAATKAKISSIYNNHFTGSQLWKIGSKEYEKVISSYNRSMKIMYDLPWETHRYFIEPLTGLTHVSNTLLNRYISFIRKLKTLKKQSVQELFETACCDVRTTTGHNIRWVMSVLDVHTMDRLLCSSSIDFEYQRIKEEDKWKVACLRELLEIREDKIGLSGFANEEINDLITFICKQ